MGHGVNQTDRLAMSAVFDLLSYVRIPADYSGNIGLAQAKVTELQAEPVASPVLARLRDSPALSSQHVR